MEIKVPIDEVIERVFEEAEAYYEVEPQETIHLKNMEFEEEGFIIFDLEIYDREENESYDVKMYYDAWEDEVL